MAKKKSIAAVAAPKPSAPQLSELELKLREMSQENEQIKAVAADSIKQLELLKKARALRRLEVEAEPEFPLLDSPATEPELPEIEPQNPDFSQEGVEYEKNSLFERTLRTFNERNLGSIEIFRIRDNGTEAKVGNYSVAEWGGSLEKIAKSFGGGEFKAVLRDKEGHFKGATRVIFDEMAYPRPQSPSTLPQAMSGNSGDIAEVVKSFQSQLEKQQDKMFQLILATMQKPVTPVQSPMSSLEEMIKLNKLMQPNPDTTPNPLKDVTTLLGLFQKGVEAGQSMTPQPEEKGDFDFMSMVKSFAPALVPALASAMASKPKPAPLAEAIQEIRTATAQKTLSQNPSDPALQPIEPQQPESAAAAEAETNPASEAEVVEPSTEGNNMGVGTNLFLMMYKGPVIDMAKSGHDVEKTAEMIILRVPEQYYPVCLDFCVKPDRVALAAGFIPELKDYPIWVDGVLASGAAILQEYFREVDKEAKQDEDRAKQAAKLKAQQKNVAPKAAPKASEAPKKLQPSIDEVEKEQKGNK